MPRQSLTKRADGRYRVKYKDQYFYGKTQTEAMQKRDEYKRAERDGLRAVCPTVSAYAVEWLPAHKRTVWSNATTITPNSLTPCAPLSARFHCHPSRRPISNAYTAKNIPGIPITLSNAPG